MITIAGSGFSGNSQVEIDNLACEIISFNYTTITCLVPHNVSHFLNKFVNARVVSDYVLDTYTPNLLTCKKCLFEFWYRMGNKIKENKIKLFLIFRGPQRALSLVSFSY